jgi:hypothetical protein
VGGERASVIYYGRPRRVHVQVFSVPVKAASAVASWPHSGGMLWGRPTTASLAQVDDMPPRLGSPPQLAGAVWIPPGSLSESLWHLVSLVMCLGPRDPRLGTCLPSLCTSCSMDAGALFPHPLPMFSVSVARAGQARTLLPVVLLVCLVGRATSAPRRGQPLPNTPCVRR